MRPGDVVGARFELEREAGAGGMGTVYRARDQVTGNVVALKVLQHLERDGDARARFGREASVLALLAHPAIVRYVTHGTTAHDEPYLVMQWLEGETLSRRLRRGPIPAGEVVRLGARIADALATAHRAGVVHRDLKPGNLMLVGGVLERVTLLDFGLARGGGAGPHVTRTGIVLGTPGYMAPEQARGDHAIDARTDVFALGCVLFRCATGRAPFAGDDPLAIMLKVLLEEPPSMRQVCSDVPEELSRLVTRMLSKDPESRPADADAVAAELALVASETDRPSAPERATAALASTERRVACLILARLPSAIATGGDPDATHRAPLEGAPNDMLRSALLKHDGSMCTLADGSLVVTVSPTGEATDQAARAARCAVAVAAVLPGSPVVLVSGRAVGGAPELLGDVIDRAARTLACTEPGEIAVDSTIEGLLDPRFEVLVGPRGKLLVGEREDIAGTRMLLGRPTPLVGRDRELSLLRAALQEAIEERAARVALVTAGAGFGKSRLRYELLRDLEGTGAEVWSGRGDSFARGSAFALIAGLLRRATGVRQGEAKDDQRAKVNARVGRHVPATSRARVAAFIGELVGAPFDAALAPELGAARLDARLMGDQLQSSFSELVEAECAAHPLVLVLEDLHWGDLPSVKMVESLLARAGKDLPLFVLAVARPEVREVFPKLFDGRELTELRLGALTAKASGQLVREVLGGIARDDVVERLVRLAAGHAFHLEELLRAVAEGRGDVLPDTVLAMVEARLGALSPTARRILRAASVFGDVFWTGGVAALLEGDPLAATAGSWLSELSRSEVVGRRKDAKFANEEEWIFRHSLVREVTYAMLAEQDRVAGHRAAAEWLTWRAEADALALAEHFERGGRAERAAEWFLAAAEQALAGSDMLAVLERTQRAVACGAAGETLGVALALRAEAHRWRGEHTEVERDARAALDLVAHGTARWLSAAAEAATVAGRVGRAEQLVEIGDLLEAIDPSSSTRPAYVIAAVRVVVQLFKFGRNQQAERLLVRIEAIAREIGDSQPAVGAQVQRVRATQALMRGDHESYLRFSTRAMELFESAGDLRNACAVRINVGFANSRLGNLEAAHDALCEADELAKRLGLDYLRVSVWHNLGFVLSRLGRYDEAERLERAAIAGYVTSGDTRLEGGSRAYLATILSLSGEHSAAEAEGERAAAVLVQAPLRAFALATLGDIRLRAGRTGPALVAARKAMAIVRSLGAIEEGDALVRVVYAECLSQTGNRRHAAKVVTEARDRLVLQAERITDPSLRQLFVTNVDECTRTFALTRTLGV